MNIIDFSMPTVGSFLVEIIIWLVKISSSIALGIVLFTVILKLITLPFDYFSRASMRKNSLKMEEMRPELEKLQKQYADNKDLYNQKMMALYKKNGYSMFGACLPTILTLVIFIVAINAFTDYSQYQNKMDFYHMSQSYNNVVYAGFDIDGNYIISNGNGEITVKDNEIYQKLNALDDNVNEENAQIENITASIFAKKYVSITHNEDATKNVYKLEIYTKNGYSIYRRSYTLKDGNPVWSVKEYALSENAQQNILYKEEINGSSEPILVAPALASEVNNQLKNSAGDDFKTAFDKENARINQLNEQNKDNTEWTKIENVTEEEYVKTFLQDIQSYKAALKYREEQSSFLWIKNIWVTDSPMKHPVESNWSAFKSTHKYTGNNITDDGYKALIAHLDEEVTAPNGYFILVALTAGISLLSQIVMGKSQKAQNELQTVDGQGAQTQKMMKWMMPIMMGVFAFMYTSAFSIYIILSSCISMATTFGINFIVDAKFKKEQAKNQKDQTVRGRIYVKKEEVKEDKKEIKKAKNTTPDADFLSGKADKKHIRGRIK